jgi:hypothetical protein
MNGQEVVEAWMSLLAEFDSCFTRPGRCRFRALATGALLCERRPLVSEIISALGLQSQWRSVEAFLECGAWPLEQLEDVLARTAALGARCGGRRHVWALDDLKVLKSGKKIWGTCSFHEYTSRCPNRAETVWAHNWVLCGALKLGPKKAFLPSIGRLYIRKDQMPAGESFRTKPQFAVEALRSCAKAAGGPHLAIFDGGYAISSVVEPLINPPDDRARIDWLTRLRFDSRLYEPPAPRRAAQMGRPRKWGRRLPAPRDADRWPGPWQQGTASLYAKTRRIRYKQVLCQWHPAGSDARVHAFAFEVEGYKKPWYLVTSDLRLGAEQVIEFYAARFAQEDAHRDLKQQLGLGAGQGRLKSVVLRTLQLRLLAMTLLRVMGAALDLTHRDAWFSRPPWYRHKRRGSLRDIKGVLTGAREHFSQLDWHRTTFEKAPCVRAERHRAPMPLRRAA